MKLRDDQELTKRLGHLLGWARFTAIRDADLILRILDAVELTRPDRALTATGPAALGRAQDPSRYYAWRIEMRRRLLRWIGRWLLGLPDIDAAVSRTLRMGVHLVGRLRSRLDPVADAALWEMSKQFIATATVGADALDVPGGATPPSGER